MPDRIQRNRTTGEYRIGSDETGWQPYSPSSGPEMYHPGATDTPTEAFLSELGRTGKEAAIGLARSPLDLIKNTLGMVAHPIDTLSGVARTVAHPIEAVKALGENPREAGSAIGQLLLGQYGVPALAPKVPGALTTVGGGLERAGTALAESKIGGFGIPGLGAAEAIFRGDPKGVAVAVAPYAMKYGGRGIRKIGEGLEGLKGAVAEEAAESPAVEAAERVSEVPYRAPQSEPSPNPSLPASWAPFTENPVTQGLRTVLEELRQRATPGLTNTELNPNLADPFGEGAALQAGVGRANLLHDPSYSTRELLADLETDPTGYTQRAITQRRVVRRKMREAAGLE